MQPLLCCLRFACTQTDPMPMLIAWYSEQSVVNIVYSEVSPFCLISLQSCDQAEQSSTLIEQGDRM